ncbi:MAG: hypothetical protein A2Y12_18945 [Planctomycetes bacterium GWF2_42_9]|nr:MAG: hypothetical protein A2Y12_18945 [Planctomycetes bacterium GWF2_42_9]
MIAYNFNPLCKEAELYFYDFLFEEDRIIPPNIVEHLNTCPYCSARMNNLDEAISQIDPSAIEEQEEKVLINTSWLKLHFKYVGKPVHCETIKPFLPGFLNPFLEVKIPTPITVHIDKCRECKEDLEKIKQYNLNDKQLIVLSQLYSTKFDNNEIECPEAKSAIEAIGSMDFSTTNKKALEHVCTCPDCRKAVQNNRDTTRKYLILKKNTALMSFPCDKVFAGELFDYVIPFGLDPQNDQYAKFRSFFTAHIMTCPICIDRMQQMHDVLYGIANREESGITTTYHIEEHSKAEETTTKVNDSAYEGFPINIETNIYKQDITNENTQRKLQFKIKARPLRKIGFAAAAVILIGSVLMFNISPAKAVSLETIYKLINEIKNVHIQTFSSNQSDPIQEQWTSRTLNVNMIKTSEEVVLWDISKKVKKIKQAKSGLTETLGLVQDDYSDIERNINGSFGLLPFNKVLDIPENTKWEQIKSDTQENIEIYELTWTKKTFAGDTTFWKWCVFIDVKTMTILKTEWFTKSRWENNYVLKLSKTIKMIDDFQMKAIVEKTFF